MVQYQIINITNSSSPTTVGFSESPSIGSVGVMDVFVSGSYAYVVDWVSGLLIINISDPSNPMLVGSNDMPGAAMDVVVSGNYAYVAGLDDITIFDVTNPAIPVLIGYYKTSGNAYNIFVSGSYAYLANGSTGLLIFDISGLP